MEARDILLSLHVATGAIGLALGPLAMRAERRAPYRSRAGAWYHWSVLAVSLTAVLLAALDWPTLWWLSVLAGVSYGLALLGLLAPRRRPRGWIRAYAHGQGGSYIALVTALLVVSLDGPASTLAWFLPTLLGLPLIEWRVAHLARRHCDTEHHDKGANDMANTYTVERKIRIDAPASAIYERIADFHRWRAWSPYEELDPAMDRTYAGAEAGVGAVYEWSGNVKAGAGRMEIVDAVDSERIVIEQRNRKPFPSESTTTFALDDSDDGTVVTWSLTGPVTLMTRIMGIFKSMDRMVGPLFEAGLARLKADAETV